MFKKSFLVASLFAVVSFTGSDLLADGAFGLNFGQALPENAKPVLGIHGAYHVEAPSPYPEFEGYVVMYSEATGVCRIFGFGKTYEDDKWGSFAKRSYEKLIIALSKKYGSVRRLEYLVPGALWDEPYEFSRSIAEMEREHKAIWEIKTEDPKNLTSTSTIVLRIVSLGKNETRLHIQYFSQGESVCQTALDEETEGSL